MADLHFAASDRKENVSFAQRSQESIKIEPVLDSHHHAVFYFNKKRGSLSTNTSVMSGQRYWKLISNDVFYCYYSKINNDSVGSEMNSSISATLSTSKFPMCCVEQFPTLR